MASRYLLLLRNEAADLSGFSEDDRAALMGKFVRWAEELKRSGRLEGVERLKAGGGQTVRRRAAALTVDGPFAEAKEAVVGLFVLNAADADEAARLAAGCPLVELGGSVEVREIDSFPVHP